MDDLIRRADAIELCRKWIDKAHEAKDQDGWWMADNLLRRTKEIPSADAVGKWIPCSERLPSENDEFLITWTASVTNKPLLAFAEYEPDALLVGGGKWLLEDDMREFKDVDVIAWMPLPKPWEGADDEKNC